MTIHYKNTFHDVMAFCFYHYLRSPFILGTYGLCFIAISLVVYQAAPNDRGLSEKLLAFLFLECVALAFFAVVFGGSVVLGMISRRNKTLYTERTLAIGEDGIGTETPYGKSEQKWAIVQKLARNRKYVFIYVAQHSAYLVPRRAFLDEAEWEAFYKLCHDHTR
jgi:hypothetical protein